MEGEEPLFLLRSSGPQSLLVFGQICLSFHFKMVSATLNIMHASSCERHKSSCENSLFTKLYQFVTVSLCIRMSLVCTRMLLVCTCMLLVCYSYVTRMLLVCYSYVTRMLLVCYSYVTRMLLVCYSYVLVCILMLLVCTRVVF